MKKKQFGGLIALFTALVNALTALFVGKRENCAFLILGDTADHWGEDINFYPLRIFRTERQAMDYVRKKYPTYSYHDLRDNRVFEEEGIMCRWGGETLDEEAEYSYECLTLYKVPCE